MTLLLSIAVALIVGLLLTRLTSLIHLPDVTAYLIAGVLLGPCLIGGLNIAGLGFSSFAAAEKLKPMSDIALGFIAFAIGSEFRLSHLKRTGSATVVIGILQAVVTTLVVDASLLALHFILGDALPLPVAITLGAIAAATAPAATLMVVRQYKAKGPLTALLLPVVALDDAVGLVIFAVSYGAARTIATGHMDILSIVAAPLLEIVFSVGIGALLGLVLTELEKCFHSNRNRLSLIAGFIVLTIAVSMLKFTIAGLEIGFSSLLVCMMLGTVFCNRCPESEDLMNRADKWSAPLLTLFFVLSGAELDLFVFTQWSLVVIGIVYIVARSLGKCCGARWACSITHRDENTRKYLGYTLLPQAGVALGMCTQASVGLGAQGEILRNVVLLAVLVYELVGPLITKIALTKAGEIKPKTL